jgi:peptidoglycan endopeptidase LytF
MNRKEIIVFSVFVNTGLLITLFIFALRPTLKGEMNIDSQEVVIVHEQKKVEEKNEELYKVDQILKEYIAKADPDPPSIKHELEVEEKVEQKVESSSLLEVIVRQGDVLEKIAKRHHTTVEDIMAINKMKDTRLRIGQILFVKENTKKKVPMTSVNTPLKMEMEEKYYTVRNGDSAWTIAIKNHIKVEELLRLNMLNEAKAKKIKPGDRLRIR